MIGNDDEPMYGVRSEEFGKLQEKDLNIYQEQTMKGKYVDAHGETLLAPGTMGQHSHSFYEIMYVEEGNVQYLLGTHRYRVSAGDVIFIPPGVVHRPILPEHMQAPYRRYVLWIHRDFFKTNMANWQNITEKMSECKIYRTGTIREMDFFFRLFRDSAKEAEFARTGWEMIVIANAIQVMVALYRMEEDEKQLLSSAEKEELYDRALAFIEAHLNEHITLEITARQLLVSEGALRQALRRGLGISFHKCLTQRRLIAAKNLMEKNIPLEEIGLMVGFDDYSSFYRAFKQEYQVSPREYRNTLR